MPYPPARPCIDCPSRREIFPMLAAGVTIGATFSFGLGRTAEAQTKVKPAVAKYQDHPNAGKNCAQCNFFRPPKSCQLVEGDISANGWCSFWAKKPG